MNEVKKGVYLDLVALDQRVTLPDSLRVLLAELPRTDWERHENFGGLTQFWLKRHLMFRQLSEMLISEAQAFRDKQVTAADYAPRLSQLAGLFLGQLDAHHRMEDAHYFPQLSRLEPRLAAGFEILDRDHVVLEGGLHGLVAATNAVLREIQTGRDGQDPAAALETALSALAHLLERHLTDEEDLVVPVILKNGVM